MEFLGYHVDAEGVSPTKEKLRAITEAPEPTNKKELQAFLGILSFYSRFLQNRASVAEKLHRLLDKDAQWRWGSEERKAFQKLKDLQ